VVHDLEISEQSIYTWRRQDRIDRGLLSGVTSGEQGRAERGEEAHRRSRG
jgi:hypothetical protein